MPQNNMTPTYTRDELLSILGREHTPLGRASLRKAIRLGVIPRPRQVSAGKGKLRFEYSASALALARALARFLKNGHSVNDFKVHIEAICIRGLSEALDLVEQLARFHAREPAAIAQHANLLIREVALKNGRLPGAAEQAWLARLPQEIAAMASMPSHNLHKSWTAWIARTRKKLEEHFSRLQA